MADRSTAGPAKGAGGGTLGRPVRVLHVDDEPAFADLVAQFLSRANEAIEVQTADGVEAALERLAESPIDCVVSDYQMREKDGLQLLQAVREAHGDLPFILFTGKGSEEIAGDAISAGVTDYLQKETGTDQFEILANRVVNAVSRFRAERSLAARAEQQSVIAWLGQRALEDPAVDDLIADAVGAVGDALRVAFVTVLAHEADREILTLRAGAGVEGDLAEASVDVGDDTPIGTAFETGVPVVVPDRTSDDRFTPAGPFADRGVISEVCVTVGPRDDPWGVLGAHATVARPFTDDEITFLRSVAHVIAEAVRRREVEARLRAGEERFRRMAEASPDVIFRLDREGRFAYASPVVESVLGYDRDALDGSFFGDMVVESSFETAVEGFQRVLEGDPVSGLRLEIRRADDETIWMEVNAVPLTDDGEVEAVLGFTRDVSAEVANQRALAEREQQFRAVFEAALDPMLLADDDGVYVDVNSAACELFGLAHDELVGRSFDEFVGEELDVDSALAAFQDEGAERGTYELVRGDGDRRVVAYSATSDVVPGLHLSILRDVTGGTRDG